VIVPWNAQALKDVRPSPSYNSRAVLLDQLSKAVSEQRVEQALQVRSASRPGAVSCVNGPLLCSRPMTPRALVALQAAASDPAAAKALQQRLASLRAAPGATAAVPVAGSVPAAAAEASPTPARVDYDQLGVSDVRRMRVEDLRAALKHFGLDRWGAHARCDYVD
jgi:hypothetical protein